MSIGENLRTFFINSTALDSLIPNSTLLGKIQQNTINENGTFPYIWYQRAGSEQEVLIGGTLGIRQDFFNIECCSDDIDEAIDLAEGVKTLLNGYQGTMGSTYIAGCFVEDHDDDYVPKNDNSDEGVHVAALSATFFHGGCT